MIAVCNSLQPLKMFAKIEVR